MCIFSPLSSTRVRLVQFQHKQTHCYRRSSVHTYGGQDRPRVIRPEVGRCSALQPWDQPPALSIITMARRDVVS